METSAATPDTGAERAPLLAPPVLAWLAARGCRQASWCTVDDALASVDRSRHSMDFAFGIGPAPGQRVGLRLVFNTAATLTEADKAAVSAYLAALGPFLCVTAPGDADRHVILPREALLALEHQLRNHLNSLLMNAAVIALRCEGQSGVDPYLEQMECDGQNCLELLRWLSGHTA